MKITEILTESKELNEGPIGNLGKAVAKGAGKAIGGIATAAGALAGVPGGMKKAFQKGKQAAISTIGGNDAAQTPTAQPAATAPAAPSNTTAAKPTGIGGAIAQFKKGAAQANTKTTAAQPAATAPEPAAQPQVTAQAQEPAAATAAQQTTAKPTVPSAQPQAVSAGQPAVDPKADTAYSQAQKAISKLPAEQQKELLAALQSDPKVKAAMSKPAAAKGKTPAASGAAANTAAPAASTSAEQPGIAKGKKKTIYKKAAPSQAEIDADRERIMGVTSDSIIRVGNNLSEALEKKIKQYTDN